MTNDPQVPWTDEQWARINQVIQEEASRARVAATFLPLYGPLPPDTDFVRKERISYDLPLPSAQIEALLAEERDELARARHTFTNAVEAAAPDYAAAAEAQRRMASSEAQIARLLGPQIKIDDTSTIKLATLQVKVDVRGAQMADPEMASVLALFRRAANVLARLEDAVVFRGLVRAAHDVFEPGGGFAGLPRIWEIHGGEPSDGLLEPPGHLAVPVPPARAGAPPSTLGNRLVTAVSDAIGKLEGKGQFGPFTVVLDQNFFLAVQTPDRTTLVLPQDRIIPFLGGGSLLRSSTLPADRGLVMALGGAPVEIVIAKDVSLQFLQVTNHPRFLFRVYEKLRLRIKEPEAIAKLASAP